MESIDIICKMNPGVRIPTGAEVAAELAEPALHIKQHAQAEICPDCGGTGQDDPLPGKYHGLCTTCGGSGKLSAVREPWYYRRLTAGIIDYIYVRG